MSEEKNIWNFCLSLVFCFSAVVFAGNPIADSASEFSTTQGNGNWYYGFYDGDSLFPYSNNSQGDDFELMTYYGPQNRWWVKEGSGGYWTDIGATLIHPNGTQTQYLGRLRELHWAVRRWISEVQGQVTINGHFAKDSAGGVGGDGISGCVLINGAKIWSQTITGYNTTGLDFSITTNVVQGMPVDFAVTPGPSNDDWYDTGIYTVTITAIPEPSLGCMLGMCFISLIRRVRGKR